MTFDSLLAFVYLVFVKTLPTLCLVQTARYSTWMCVCASVVSVLGCAVCVQLYARPVRRITYCALLVCVNIVIQVCIVASTHAFADTDAIVAAAWAILSVAVTCMAPVVDVLRYFCPPPTDIPAISRCAAIITASHYACIVLFVFSLTVPWMTFMSMAVIVCFGIAFGLRQRTVSSNYTMLEDEPVVTAQSTWDTVSTRQSPVVRVANHPFYASDGYGTRKRWYTHTLCAHMSLWCIGDSSWAPIDKAGGSLYLSPAVTALSLVVLVGMAMLSHKYVPQGTLSLYVSRHRIAGGLLCVCSVLRILTRSVLGANTVLSSVVEILFTSTILMEPIAMLVAYTTTAPIASDAFASGSSMQALVCIHQVSCAASVFCVTLVATTVHPYLIVGYVVSDMYRSIVVYHDTPCLRTVTPLADRITPSVDSLWEPDGNDDGHMR
jgi:hypothetical protein